MNINPTALAITFVIFAFVFALLCYLFDRRAIERARAVAAFRKHVTQGATIPEHWFGKTSPSGGSASSPQHVRILNETGERLFALSHAEDPITGVRDVIIAVDDQDELTPPPDASAAALIQQRLDHWRRGVERRRSILKSQNMKEWNRKQFEFSIELLLHCIEDLEGVTRGQALKPNRVP